jgi:hypothetical protein
VDAVRGFGEEPNPPLLLDPAPRLKLPGENSAGFDGVVDGIVEGDPKMLPPGLTVGVIENIADLRLEAELSVESSRGRLGVEVDVCVSESTFRSDDVPPARMSRTNCPAEPACCDEVDTVGGASDMAWTGPASNGFGTVVTSFCGGAGSCTLISTSSAVFAFTPFSTGPSRSTSFPFRRLTTSSPAFDCIFIRWASYSSLKRSSTSPRSTNGSARTF